jgi:hypothetical protein
MADGSFLVKANNDACFQLKQRSHGTLFAAFQLLFSTNRKIDVTQQGRYMQLSVSSLRDIQVVINFFSGLSGFSDNAGLLTGNKLIQYNT